MDNLEVNVLARSAGRRRVADGVRGSSAGTFARSPRTLRSAF